MRKFGFRQSLVIAAASLALTVFGATAQTQADDHHRSHSHARNRSSSGYSVGGYTGSGYRGTGYRGYNGPVYHAPSVHYHTQYHADRLHYTPSRGLHTHGHYDVVPHYTPGHFDYQHRNHIHANPRYHY